jgi:ribosome biogenesis protein ENP2
MYGRDFSYHEASADLYFVGASTEISRLNLELGKFMMPLKTDVGDCNVNCCEMNSFHNLFAAGTTLGHIVCFDPRTRNRVGILDSSPHAIAENTDVQNLPGVTSIKFKDHLCMAVGTATGQVLLYDLRSERPLLVKDHNFGLPIKDIEFHPQQNLVLSCDSRILKLWDINTGKAFTSIEPTDTKLNDLCIVRDTGMLFLANEAPKILTYYIPALGPAPKWCAFLDSLTEELEENPTPTVYDDYKFLTRSELDGLGLSHLIGTDFVRAYMHGFFIDIRLYHKAKSISGDFMYDEYRQKKIREKIDMQTASRVKTQKLPKVNRALAEKLIELENKESKNKKKLATTTSLLTDSRFSKLFSDADFEVDVDSEEYRLLNPVVSKREKKQQMEADVNQLTFDDDHQNSSDDDNDNYDDNSVSDSNSVDDDGEDDDDEDIKHLKQLTKHRRTLDQSAAKNGLSKLIGEAKTIGELCEEEDVIQPTQSAFGNMELTFKLKSSKAEANSALERRQQHEERKKLRRSAGKLASKKSAPKFWMGQRVR